MSPFFDSHNVTIIFLPLLAACGEEQMALDEAIFHYLATMKDASTVTLFVRCYIWIPATWSLGKLQKDSPSLAAMTKDHPVVRRPTGGRAILHDNDISFMFASNHLELLQLSVNQSYCVFLDWLKQTLEALKVPLLKSETCLDSAPYQLSDLCFETHLPSEVLSADGKKLCGMAQARQKKALLQHGAVFLSQWHISPEAFASELFETIQHHCPNAVISEQSVDSIIGLPELWAESLENSYSISGESAAFSSMAVKA